ncbi:1,4-alpha-glucan branching protein GlgB [Brytella acorum]|uniref:1,4-alpha-glucan branching enzyme GlgB n=1 Tax=Brytella acorum TaxID=2959299 RepID=A0AA35Y2J0_9PROT|nr:1,4-alpha-glucan branching protein GlgB [Brytella acorum]MDF3625856.1 1,4-alpha-glucan branching protein GlgB [Brytella acorum]CAI9121590.1 1,4-alpha-glucan branching protein GlgB [Brytella acorum]
MPRKQDEAWFTVPEHTDELLAGRYGDPFSILGRHQAEKVDIIRAFYPDAANVRLIVQRPRSAEIEKSMRAVDDTGMFIGTIPRNARYRFKVTWADAVEEVEDPYSIGPVLDDAELEAFARGAHFHLHCLLGAHARTFDGIDGVLFAVWAPNARRVSVIGDFNIWDGRRHPMRLRHRAGVWELFIPGLHPGERYKYEILSANGEILPQKADPYAAFAERPPATASVVVSPWAYDWHDESWMAARHARHAPEAPISIYELHIPSWRRPGGNCDRVATWDDLERDLIPYVREAGFTHIELLPIMEHPFGGSWGYQPLGLFAPTARHGTPQQFAAFIDACHQAEIGVILDWVPAHFPNDVHGLAQFDGTALFEHMDPREGLHEDWNTLIYNFGRHEVRAFLISSAVMWLEQFHIDGLRVDAVASMLYRDYSRAEGQWVPNIHGGRENLEAVGFIRELNDTVRRVRPDVMVIAEESTAWPGVTQPTADGGLGFAYKWNMGWMHDTLHFMERDPLWRGYHLSEILFGTHYGFSERFVLSISHDEVTHGKGSLLARMPGDEWQRHAGLRSYLAFMWTHPGKKLIFMGCEIAQDGEWEHGGEIPWHSLENPLKAGTLRLVSDLNHTLRRTPALHERDADPRGFQWVVGDDVANIVFAWVRYAQDGPPVVVVWNTTPVIRQGYRVGVPEGGFWREIMNTDAAIYGGSNVGNGGGVSAERSAAHGHPWSLDLVLPPMALLILSPVRTEV